MNIKVTQELEGKFVGTITDSNETSYAIVFDFQPTQDQIITAVEKTFNVDLSKEVSLYIIKQLEDIKITLAGMVGGV